MNKKYEKSNTHHVLANFSQRHILNILLPSERNSKQKINEAFISSSLTLHQAARDGQLEIVQQYLKLYGKDKKKVNFKDEDETTALHYAVRYSHFPIVKILVESGANVNIPGQYGATPLHYASRFVEKKLKITIDSNEHYQTPEIFPKFHSCTDTNNTTELECNNTKDKKNNLFIENTNEANGLLSDSTLSRSLNVSENSVKTPSFVNIKTSKKKPFKKVKDKMKEECILRYLLDQQANVNAKDINGSTPLHYAAMRGNKIAVEMLLMQKNINIEAIDNLKMTPLHCASIAGSYDVCLQLLKRNAKIICTDKENMTPLHFAAMEGHLDIVKLLFCYAETRGGVTLSAKLLFSYNRDKQSALHLAVENNHIDIVKFCINRGSNVNLAKVNSISPLHSACSSGLLDIAKLLVDNGAVIDSKNSFQETPLHRAALFNHTEIIEFLLIKGVYVDCRDKDNETPLLIAVRKNYVESVKLLLEYSANIYAKDANDKTCLFLAAQENSKEALEILCKLDISNLLEEFDKHEMTPLHVAAKEGHDTIVLTLLGLGSRIDAKCYENLTPLHLAAKYGHSRIVQLLLSNVLSIVNDVDDSSNTPLHLAAMEGHVKIVEMLIEAGSPLDTRNANQMTPLDCAAYRGWNQCAQCLLDADSVVNPTDVKITSLHLACREGHVGMVNLLLSRNADVTRRDHFGKNCLDYAIENNQREVAMAIIGCNNWKNALRNSTVEGNNLTTPMRKLIQKLPDVAEQVFNQCVSDNGLPFEHPKYKIKYNFEFLEDMFAPWCTIALDDSEYYQHRKSLDFSHRRSLFSLISSISTKFPVDWMKTKDFKHNHPLKFMVQNERTGLLCHPLVTCLLKCKWSICGRYAYYSRLLLYMIFLFFINGYGLSLRANLQVSNNSYSCVPFNPNNNLSNFFIDPGRYIVIVLSAISLSIEFAKLIINPYNYIRVYRAVELGAYICSLVYAKESFSFSDESSSFRCSFTQNQLGAASLTLSWLGLVLFLRKFPKLGIYVFMFTHILKSFVQIAPVMFLFMIAFGLGSHLVIFMQDPRSYTTPLHVFMKILLGMMGEYEFDNIYNHFYNPIPSAWVIYLFFVIINCILLFNLLVGLAADDIETVQKQAIPKRLAMLVDLTLDVEKALPISIQKHLVKMEESIYPNVYKSKSLWSFWSFESPSTNIKSKNNIKNIKKEQIELEENIHKLSRRIKAIEAQNNRIEELLNGIINHININE